MYSGLFTFVCVVFALEYSVYSKPITVGTYNTYLAVAVFPSFMERKNAIIDKLNDKTTDTTDAPDVLCLQEVVKRSDQQDIARGVRRKYKYTASFFNSNTGVTPGPACDEALTKAYLQCFLPSCSDPSLRPFEALRCGQTRCREQIAVISQACLSCVSYYSFLPSVSNPFALCWSNVTYTEFEDPSGVLILSKYKLKNITTKYYVETSELKDVIHRGYVSAYVKGFQLQVVCTHLTPIFSAADRVPYVGPEFFRTYERRQHFEVTKLLELVEKYPNLVLLGDFNTGPAIHNLSWVAPYNYGLMNARGLVSVNSLLCGECTYCRDNPLTPLKEPDSLLDHVFVPVSLLPYVSRVKRIFVEDRLPSGLSLSDHYGISAKLRRGTKPLRVYRQICPNNPVFNSDSAIPFAPVNVSNNTELINICP